MVAEDDRLAEHGGGRIPRVDVGLERVDDGVFLRLRVHGAGQRQPEHEHEGEDDGEGSAPWLSPSSTAHEVIRAHESATLLATTREVVKRAVTLNGRRVVL